MTTTRTVRTEPILIDGQRVRAASGATIPATNPATGETIAEVPRCDAGDVARAVSAASAALPGWRDTDPAGRAARLNALAAAIESDAERLSDLDVADNGSPRHEMRKDAASAARKLRYFAGLVLQVRGETLPSSPGRLNYSLRQPYGVVGRLMPFNHPLMFSAAKIAAPLAAGNTIVVKPSEHTSLSTLALCEHIADIFPSGVVNVVTGYGGEAGDALVTHPDVRRLAFIGSAGTGQAILRRAAEAGIKHVTLELGGKNPLVVFPDADLDTAVDGAVAGMNFTWQGQSCGSTSRVLVHRDAYDAFVARLADRVGALRPGLPDDPGCDLGAIVNEQQMEKVLRYIDIGVEDGARLVTGGTRVTDGGLANGLFVRPAVFADVAPDSRLAQEEIFGPVLAVIRYDDYADALRIANGIGYGLTAAAYTRDLETAHRFARDVEAGYVWINETSRHIAGASFGGVKGSGLGREEDLEELVSYTESKNVHIRYGAS